MVALLHRGGITPAESELNSAPGLERNVEDDFSPTSFLARCKAIVDSVASPRHSVPVNLKHRVREFRPKARAVQLRRTLRLLVPERWNESSVKRTEKILGLLLILIAFFLFKPSEDLGTLCSGPSLMPVEIDENTEAPTVEMPLVAAVAADPAFLQQMAPANNAQSYSRFHSFADPNKRFNFDQEPRWKSDYLMSTQAACGVAQHFQHSMPVMLRKGKRPAWNSDKDSNSSAKRIVDHPLIARLLSQVKQTAFENYVDSNQLNPSTVAISGVMNRFRVLTRVLNESCGPAPNAEEVGGDE